MRNDLQTSTQPCHVALPSCLSMAAYPDKVALRSETCTLTYEAMQYLMHALMAELANAGIQQGDHVLLLLDQPIETMILTHALWLIGCVVILHAPIQQPHLWAFLLEDTQASWAITQYHPTKGIWHHQITWYHTSQQRIIQTLPDDWLLSYRRERPDPPPIPDVIPSDLALMIYTSGSTGKPKAVMLSHRNIDTARQAIVTYLDIQAHHRIFSTLPMWFDYGLYQALLALSVGASTILHSHTLNPHSWLDRVAHYQPDYLPITPHTAQWLATFIQRHPTPAVPHACTITTTGSSLDPSHLHTLQHTFPNATVFVMYGQTECKRCSYLPPSSLAQMPADQPIPLGQAIPGTRMYLMKEDGSTPAPHEPAQIVVEGEHIMMGYWKRPAQTAKRLGIHPYTGHRILYTGDWGQYGPDGHVYFLGRQDDLIKCRGIRISPDAVSFLLHPMLTGRTFSVIIAPLHETCDHQPGIVVFVCCHTDELQAIQWACRKRIPSTHQPHHWHACDTLPTLSNGKIDRHTLAQWHAQRSGHLSEAA